VDKTDGEVTIAMVNPLDLVGRNTATEFLKKYHLNWVCILQPDFEQFRDKQLFDLVAPTKAEKSGPAEIIYLASDPGAGLDANSEAAGKLDEALHFAIEEGASDLHLEPAASGVAVRGRVDGRLIELAAPIPLNNYNPVVSRLKALSDLDITEVRMPQES